MTPLRLAALALVCTLALLVGLIVLVIADRMLTHGLARMPGLGWFDGWSVGLTLLAIWALLPKSYKVWHRDYEIRGSVLIDAPAERIWRLLRPTPGQPYFLNTVSEIRAVDGAPARVDMLFHPTAAASRLPPLQCVIEAEERLVHLRLGYLNREAFPLWSRDLVASEYTMRRDKGQWRVTHVERLDKLRVTTVLALLFINPCHDGICRLKALSEGTPDPSLLGRIAQGAVPGGAWPAEMARGVQVVGATVCVVLTAFTFGLLWVIANLGGS